jgi:hypothetical protein
MLGRSIIDAATRDADRREHLCEHAPKTCPACGSRQIRLQCYIDVSPARWQCREPGCLHKWEYEP